MNLHLYYMMNLKDAFLAFLHATISRLKIAAITGWKVSVFGVFLVRILRNLDWMRRDTEDLSVFSPNAEKKDTFQAVYNLYFLRETSLFFWIASEYRILYMRLNQHKFVSHCYFHCSILSHLSSLRLHFDIFFILFSLLVGAWNYNPSKNNMQENPFIKFYWIRHTFAVERDIP